MIPKEVADFIRVAYHDVIENAIREARDVSEVHAQINHFAMLGRKAHVAMLAAAEQHETKGE